MRYEHRFQVRATLTAVAEFHTRSNSMGAITPPPIITRLHRAPARLSEGDEMEFTLWVGPLPLRWLAKIEQVSQEGFTDRQLRGPFEAWEHRHQFIAVDGQTTQVVDSIQARIRRHWFWGPVGLGMWLGLPVLFAYRAWKTGRILNQKVNPG